MKRLLLLALLSLPTLAHAARVNCTASCTFVADAYPSTGPVPTSCKLYAGSVFKAQAPAVAVTGGVQCQVRASFPVGNYSVTMTAIDSTGVETAPSLPFAFDSFVPLPAPANLRIVP